MSFSFSPLLSAVLEFALGALRREYWRDGGFLARAAKPGQVYL
jgi:hypothetical protein